MNWLDTVAIIVLIISTFTGLMQGFIKMILSLAGTILGIILASNFYREVAVMLTFISNQSIANIAAFVIILLAVTLLATLAAILLRNVVRAVTLGWVDRIGGAIFGFLMAALFISAIVAITVKFVGEGAAKESLLATILLDKFAIVIGLIPSEFDAIRQFFK